MRIVIDIDEKDCLNEQELEELIRFYEHVTSEETIEHFNE